MKTPQWMGMMCASIMTMMSLSGMPVMAQEQSNSGEPERNWELWLGGGSQWKPEYSGSDTLAISPVPLIFGFYETPRFRLFANGDEAGVAVKMTEQMPLSLFAGAKLGQFNRDHDDDPLLIGTPDIENAFQVIGGIESKLPMFTLSATARYLPISADYKDSLLPDADYDGLMADLDISKDWMKIPFIFTAKAGMAWMNSDVAKANYSVTAPTARLNAFNADSGLHDVHASAGMALMLHEHAGTFLMADVKYLVGDAADSPVTQEKVQPSFGIFAFYRF